MRRRRYVWSRLLALLLGALVGAGAAGLTGWLTPDPAGAHLEPWGHTWPYSFTSSSCDILNVTEVDPISIVYYENASTGNVDAHYAYHGYAHHGLWDNHDPSWASAQYFYDHVCLPQDSENSTGDLWQSRYHQRHFWNWDEPWGIYSISTPHYEDITKCDEGNLSHAVRENGSSGMPEGGYRNAKMEIGWHWHNWNNGGGAAHYWAGWQDWDNLREFRQCDGQYARGDGDVDFIEIR